MQDGPLLLLEQIHPQGYPQLLWVTANSPFSTQVPAVCVQKSGYLGCYRWLLSGLIELFASGLGL